MFQHWLVTGDTHGKNLERISCISEKENTAIIILGDAGFNFYLNKTDKNNKRMVQDTGITVYCVRGNHEERPENIKGMEQWYDPTVKEFVYREPQFPNIRYFIDGCCYDINGHSALVIGGAYSVDKYYRIGRYHNGQSSMLGWFPQEQLSEEEMKSIEEEYKGKHFDFVLSHTCPKSWEPTDLFLDCVDQSTVDKTMERWMDKLKDMFDWKVWLFGHYHDDRLVRPGVEMYSRDIEDIETVFNRWLLDEDIPWWMKRDPHFNCDFCQLFYNGCEKSKKMDFCKEWK